VNRAWLIGGAVAIVVIIGVAIAVLASGDDSASSAGATTPAGAPEGLSEEQAQLEEFRSCMSDQGVELPQPGEGPTIQGPSPEMLEAMQQCQQYLPEGVGPGGGAPGLRIQPSP
jgi:hypothetical protein